MQIICADCGSSLEEYRKSNPPTECPNCKLDAYCWDAVHRKRS